MKGRLAREYAIDPRNLQPSLFKLLVRVSAVLGGLTYLPSVYAALKYRLFSVAAIDTVAILAAFALVWLDGLSLRFRAAALCSIYYVLGVGLLMGVGSIGQIYLLGFSLITVLLLGTRAGLYSALLSSVSLLAIGARGYAAPGMAIPHWRQGLAEWVVITINFALIDTLLTLAVGAVLATVNDALTREIAGRTSLDHERKLLRTLIDTLPDVVFTKDTSGRFVNCNRATLARFGLDREEEVTGKTVFDLYSPELAAPRHLDDQQVMAGRALLDREEQGVGRNGKPEWLLTTKVPLLDVAGKTVGLLGISRNITDRKQAEAERDRLLTQLQLQIERMPLAYLLSDHNLCYTRWNPAAEKIFGFTETEVLGRHSLDVIVPAESRAAARSILESIVAGSMDAHGVTENRTKAGVVITCEWHNTPLFDTEGAFAGVLSLAQDITSKRRLEIQLRQSQKMEAVGRLAGGVAHDFNNVLSVVLSYSEMLIEDLVNDDQLRADVDEIRKAAMRAADLTRQLLMFSRKQVVQPKVLDLNDVLSDVDRMLQRLVGEDIELTLVPGAALGRVRADPGSIEQVIVNLTVNARDAMPVGGKITMQTENIEIDEEFARTHLRAKPGNYVMFSVTDTGTGMDKATLARIFEPFFTTKEAGKGTGLGLATVFGIVEQSGGTIWVYSELGIGTTFKIYLPRVDSDVDLVRPRADPGMLRGSETILLVEDEDQVRAVARGILRRYGYTVLDAHNAGEAFRLSAQHVGPIHLLLSDVVMPETSGPTLARRLAQGRPEMKVICMSGYTDDAAVRHGVVDAEFAYLQKPITVDTLTRKVRHVLDSIGSGP